MMLEEVGHEKACLRGTLGLLVRTERISSTFFVFYSVHAFFTKCTLLVVVLQRIMYENKRIHMKWSFILRPEQPVLLYKNNAHLPDQSDSSIHTSCGTV